jgi:hypothetical protein
MAMAGRGSTKRCWVFFAWLAGVVILLPSAHADGPRLVTRLEQPVSINGEVYPAGELSVREVGALSPSVTLNEVCAGGKCLGLLQARAEPDGTPSSGDALLFEPDDRGNLVLVGFSYRGQSAREFACPRPGVDGVTVRGPAAPSTTAAPVVAAK